MNSHGKKLLGISDVWNKFQTKTFVYLLEAKGLKGVDKDGMSDPVAKIIFGKTTQKSKVVKKSNDPKFSDLFFFVDPEESVCRVELWDNKKGKFLGQVEILHLETLSPEKVHDVWFDLQSRPGKKKKDDVSGKIRCRFCFSKSPETRNGEELAYKAFFQEYTKQFKTGDLVVYNGIGLLPTLTKVLTGCSYTHLGMIVEMPNRWTKLPELYVVEIFRNPDNFLDIATDQVRHDISMFRLHERFYQFYGTQIWYLPLKEPMDATGVARILDYVQTCLSDPEEFKQVTAPFDGRLQTWVQTVFGAKHFPSGDFIDLHSGSFITQCLRMAEVIPDGTNTAAPPLAVVSYPCYSEPLLIRPSDKSELEALQNGIKTGMGSASFSGVESSPRQWDLNLPTVRPAFEEKRSSYVMTDGVNEHVLRIYFEGFKDLKMATMSLGEGSTAGDIRQEMAHKKQLNPKTMKIYECFDEKEIPLGDDNLLKLSASKNPDLKYAIKIRYIFCPDSPRDSLGSSLSSSSDDPSTGRSSSSSLFEEKKGPGGHSSISMIVGQFNAGNYTKHEKVGGGAFGSVWRVGFEGFTCAMKVLTITEKTDLYDIEALKLETEILERANHKNVVRYLGHEFHETEMRLFLEFCPFSLRDVLNQMRPNAVTPSNCKKIILNVARGLNYLHNLTPPVIHRDIKSANILVNRDPEGGVECAKLCDFGVSKLIDRENQAQTYVGTVAFMAPEIRQGRGKKAYTTAVDIYSLGIVMWEVLTLQSPHKITRRPDWSGPEFNRLYEIQASCCKANPSLRPTAKQLADSLALMYHDD